MIMYLPEIYPDELVYSWFGRYAVHAGCLTHRTALRELLAKRSCNPSKEFIGNLNPEARQVIAGMYPMEQLVAEHTMYPQYARFLSPPEKKEALERLAYDACDAHHLFAILPRGEGERYLRYCPVCAAEDRARYGETYWHRKHQLRGIRICPRHRCRLVESGVTAKSEQVFSLDTAEEAVAGDMQAVQAGNPAEVQFAEYMERVFDAPMDTACGIPASAVIYHAIRQSRYTSGSGKLRYMSQLAADIRENFAGIAGSAASIHQIYRTLERRRFDFSVICQLGFFLGVEAETLVSPQLSVVQTIQAMPKKKEAMPEDWQAYDEETAPAFERTVRDIYTGAASAAGRPERVSERIIQRELGLSRYWLAHMPRCRAIFEEYTEPYGETFARRIIWAYRRLKKEKDTVYWVDIRRLAGVKKKNFPAAQPYLEKYADRETVEEILSLV